MSTNVDVSTDEPPAPAGPRALAHPIAVASLVVLVVNDHVLKAMFGSPLTGKLSDIAGAVLLPLLVAVLLERRTRFAIEIGMFTTAIVLTSINVVPVADRAYESVLSIIVPSVNTMDSADLFAVPFVFVAQWVWGRRTLSERALRHAWGRAVFIIGLGALAATSNAEPISASVEGTHVLTADEPTVEIPVNLRLSGEDAQLDRYVYTSISTTVFGEDSPEPVRVTTSGVGDGLVTLTLTDIDAAPVEVRWSMYAAGEAAEVCVPICLGGGDPERVPQLEVDAPDDTFGPEPFLTVPIELDWETAPTARRVLFEFAPGEHGMIVQSDEDFGPSAVRLVIEAQSFDVQGGGSITVPRPASCAGRCEVEMILSVMPDGFNGSAGSIRFFDQPKVDEATTASLDAVELRVQRVTLPVELLESTDSFRTNKLAVAIRGPRNVSPIDVIDVQTELEQDEHRAFGLSSELRRDRVDALADSGGCVLFRVERSSRPVDDGSVPSGEAKVVITRYSAATSLEPGELVAGIGQEALTVCS